MSDEKKYCSTCEWYDILTGICLNKNSEFRADFRCLDDICQEWKGNDKKTKIE